MGTDVLIRLNAMGDILLCIPTVRALTSLGHDVLWVINSKWAPLAQFLPARVVLYHGTRDLLSLTKRIRAMKPGRVIDLQGKVASIFMAMFAGVPVLRYKKRTLKAQISAACGSYPLLNADRRPVWRRYLETAEIFGATPDPRLHFPPGYLNEIRAYIAQTFGWQPRSYYLIHRAASHQGKYLSDALLDAMAAKADLPVGLIGIDNLLLQDSKISDLRTRVDLYHLPGLLHFARGLISSDSGPMHLARAVNCPLTAVFVQTDPLLGFSPVPGRNVKIISRSLPCKPCSLHGQRTVCPEEHWRCQQLDWQAVADEALAFFEQA